MESDKKKLEINLTINNINKITLKDDAKLFCDNKIIAHNFSLAAFDNSSFNLDLNAESSYFRVVKSVSGEILLTGNKAIMMFDENAFMKGNVVLNELELSDYEIGFISTTFGAMSAKVNTIIDFFFGGSSQKQDKQK